MYGKFTSWKCVDVSFSCLYKRRIEKASLLCILQNELCNLKLLFSPAPNISTLLQNLLLSA